MPWCPKCGLEYREGFSVCNDCSCELVDEPVEIETETEAGAEPETDAKTLFEYSGETFLVSVGDSIEADMLEGLLAENRIPVLKKYGSAGDYMKIFMGSTHFGVDLYVPTPLFGKAMKIIQASQGSLEEFAISDEELEAQALAAAPADMDEEEDEEEDYGEEDYEEDGDEENCNEKNYEEESEDEKR